MGCRGKDLVACAGSTRNNAVWEVVHLWLEIELMSDRKEVRYERRQRLKTSKESEGNKLLEKFGARNGSKDWRFASA